MEDKNLNTFTLFFRTKCMFDFQKQGGAQLSVICINCLYFSNLESRIEIQSVKTGQVKIIFADKLFFVFFDFQHAVFFITQKLGSFFRKSY